MNDPPAGRWGERAPADPRALDRAVCLPRMDAVVRHAKEQVLSDLPKDLIKLVYLASLRDCNTGNYFHSLISLQNDAASASHALQFCHEEVFDRLMATPLSEYVAQLAGYICYTHADKIRVIDMWRSLPAYRATVPLNVSVMEAEFFFTSIETALAILDSRRLRGLMRVSRVGKPTVFHFSPPFHP